MCFLTYALEEGVDGHRVELFKKKLKNQLIFFF